MTAGCTLKADLPDQASLQQQIVQSLRDRQTPVIGLGVFGPPEPFLITGYDDSGAVLLGWSHFQSEKKGDPNISFEPAGQFRLRNWHEAIDGVVIVTGEAQRPAQRGIYRDAIERGIRELRTTQGKSGGDTLGTAAMEKWAIHLETDADFTGLVADQLRKSQSDHGVTAGDLAERRALAASFIELAIRALPAAKEDLALAQAAFQGSHDTVYEIWETIARNGPFDPDLEKFADPARRRTMAMLVRRLADFDRRGMVCLERALKIVGGKQPGEPIPANTILDGDAVLEKATAPPGEPPIWAPENIHIANSLSMLQAFLGEGIGQLNDAEKSHRKLSYVLWMGLSGAAFGMLADGPERANLPLVFDALGYDYELWMNGQLARETGLPARDWGWDDNLRRRIFWNLRDRRLPALLFGCGKWPDWYLVTQVRHWGDLRGYGGNSGEGYRPNEPLDDPKNPLREIHLMDAMKGKQTWTINLTGKRSGDKPSMEELYRRAMEWGAKQMRGAAHETPRQSGAGIHQHRSVQGLGADDEDGVAVPGGRSRDVEGSELVSGRRGGGTGRAALLWRGVSRHGGHSPESPGTEAGGGALPQRQPADGAGLGTDRRPARGRRPPEICRPRCPRHDRGFSAGDWARGGGGGCVAFARKQVARIGRDASVPYCDGTTW